jgi:hypothetical protein
MTTKREYSLTIRRAAFAWCGDELNRETLEHSREVPNNSIHLDRFPESDGETIMYQLKRQVEMLTYFFLMFGRRFGTPDDIQAVPDLPQTTDKLRKQIGLREFGLGLLSE